MGLLMIIILKCVCFIIICTLTSPYDDFESDIKPRAVETIEIGHTPISNDNADDDYEGSTPSPSFISKEIPTPSPVVSDDYVSPSISNDEFYSPHPTPFMENPFAKPLFEAPVWPWGRVLQPISEPTTSNPTGSPTLDITPAPTPYKRNPYMSRTTSSPQPTPFVLNPRFIELTPQPTPFLKNPAVALKKTPYPTNVQQNPGWISRNFSPKPTLFNENPAYPLIWSTSTSTSAKNGQSLSPTFNYYYDAVDTESIKPTPATSYYYYTDQEEKIPVQSTIVPTISPTDRPSPGGARRDPRIFNTAHPFSSSHPRLTPTHYPTQSYEKRSHLSEDDDDILELIPQATSNVTFQQVMVATLIRTLAIMVLLGAIGIAWFQNRDIISDYIQRHGYTPRQTRYAEVEMPDVSSGGGL